MKRNTISQRQAREWRRRALELERAEWARRNEWSRDYPGGTHIATIEVLEMSAANTAVKVARKLNHAVVVINVDGALRLYAVPRVKPHDA